MAIFNYNIFNKCLIAKKYKFFLTTLLNNAAMIIFHTVIILLIIFMESIHRNVNSMHACF